MGKYLPAYIGLDSHGTNILAALGDFDPEASILPTKVRNDEPLGLRLAFDLEMSQHCNSYETKFWNLWYWKWNWHFALDAIQLLYSAGSLERIMIKDFGIAPPQMLIYDSGNLTIEDLLGYKITESQVVNIKFEMVYYWHVTWDKYYACPFGWCHYSSGSYFPPTLDEQIIESFDYSVEVEVPPPPLPNLIFNRDYCWLSKTTVAPNEQFKINVRVEETNNASGSYSIKSLCEGQEQVLGSGTITAKGTKSHSFTVTANQLAQREITSSQYLSFNIDVYNEETRTDRWTPAAIAVIVEPNGEKATLSGKVTDKTTGQGLLNVSVSTVGRTVYTDTNGNYTIDNLEPGYYTIVFKKSGYYDVTKSKTLVTGSNILNVVMTPTTEPRPTEIPWGLIGGVGAVALGILIYKGKKGEE